ncbi:hypothetical protein EW145_g2854 [Phellinidium pouzarii]|uniref:Protein N-terminal glutamine amidohydrolase n=1 Tax=Phellinidium pouzarii TaxID=167371 RepID=A0A4S4L976_9AGAM|nr:hypothetical protein EW145_g2854 [Phellinidium pouzarii]
MYTANWCEENVYLLAKTFIEDRTTCELWRVYAIFISNRSKSVALWQQKLREDVVLWDYHVILALRPRHSGPAAGRRVWVYDMDSRLDVPCSLEDYISLTFPYATAEAAGAGWTVSDAYRSMFRIVDGEEYLQNFASDRTHMLALEPGLPRYLSPPPQYGCLQGAKAKSSGISNNLMSSFVCVDDTESGHGQVYSIEKVASWGTLLY